MVENVFATEDIGTERIVFRFDEDSSSFFSEEVWQQIESRFGGDDEIVYRGRDVDSQSFTNVVSNYTISLQRELCSNPGTEATKSVWSLVAREKGNAGNEANESSVADFVTYELEEQLAEYIYKIAVARNSEAVSWGDALKFERVTSCIRAFFPIKFATLSILVDLVHAFNGEEAAPDVNWAHMNASKYKNDKQYYGTLKVALLYCACVRVAGKRATELQGLLEVVSQEAGRRFYSAQSRKIAILIAVAFAELGLICAAMLFGGSGFSLSSPLLGNAYWRSCSNSTTALGYGGQASLDVTQFSEVPLYTPYPRVALATQYRFPQTVSAIRALDSVSGPYASPWRTVPTFCVDLYTALRNATGAAPSAALTLTSCAGLLAAEFPDVALHNNVSSFTWQWVKSIPALMLTFSEELNTISGFSISSNTSNAASFDLSSSGTLTTTFQLPTTGCIANALTFRGTRCVLYNDESAMSTPYLFVVLSVLRIVCLTLLVNLVLFPYVLTPLKRCLSCLVGVPLIGDIVSDIDVPLTTINFQQIFPDCLKPHDSMEDRMNSEPESFYHLTYDAETLTEATEELLMVGRRFIDELVGRFGPQGCVKSESTTADDGADGKDEDPVVASTAPRPAHFDMHRETAKAVVIGLLATRAKATIMTARRLSLFKLKFFFHTYFDANYLGKVFPELARAPPLFAYTEINAILERLDLPLEAQRRLTSAISSDLWFMVTEYDEYCLRAIFSEPMVLLYAYLHQSYHERFVLSKGEAEQPHEAEEPHEDSNDAVDEFSVEIKVQPAVGQSPPPTSSQRIISRLREVCPTLSTNDWYSYGDEAWTFERKEGPAMMSVEEYVHKMYKDYPQIPGVVARRQQMAYHGVQRVTPGKLLIFFSLVSTLGVALLDLVQGHNKQLTPVDSPLIPAAFRFVNTGSLVTMHVNWWLINRIEGALSLPPGSHSIPLVARAYFWGYETTMLVAAVFFVPGLLIAFGGFIMVFLVYLIVALVLGGPLVMIHRTTRSTVSGSSSRRMSGIIALSLVTFYVIVLSVGVALFVQMPFNIGYMAFLRARAEGNVGALWAGDGLDMVLNEYESRLLSCWMEDVYNSIPSSMAQRLSYFALP